MKQCPVCKTAYTDESLSFCLSDGASLTAVLEAEKTVQMSFDEPMRINAPSDSVQTFFSPANASPPPSRKSSNTLLIAALGGLVLLGILGAIGVIGYFALRDGEKKDSAAKIPPTPAQTASPMPTAIDETAALKEKLANLEKQVQNQKNQKPTSTVGTFSPPKQPPVNSTTARVNSPGDGFLALRNQPDSEIGERLAKIPHGASVTVLGCPKASNVGEKQGRWCQVIYNGQAGWAFDAFLVF